MQKRMILFFLTLHTNPVKKIYTNCITTMENFFLRNRFRLSETLKSLPKSKHIRWAMTNSSHKDILKLYKGFNIKKIPIGTSDRPGIQTKNSNEVLITNY